MGTRSARWRCRPSPRSHACRSWRGYGRCPSPCRRTTQRWCAASTGPSPRTRCSSPAGEGGRVGQGAGGGELERAQGGRGAALRRYWHRHTRTLHVAPRSIGTRRYRSPMCGRDALSKYYAAGDGRGNSYRLLAAERSRGRRSGHVRRLVQNPFRNAEAVTGIISWGWSVPIVAWALSSADFTHNLPGRHSAHPKTVGWLATIAGYRPRHPPGRDNGGGAEIKSGGAGSPVFCRLGGEGRRGGGRVPVPHWPRRTRSSAGRNRGRGPTRPRHLPGRPASPLVCWRSLPTRISILRKWTGAVTRIVSRAAPSASSPADPPQPHPPPAPAATSVTHSTSAGGSSARTIPWCRKGAVAQARDAARERKRVEGPSAEETRSVRVASFLSKRRIS